MGWGNIATKFAEKRLNLRSKIELNSKVFDIDYSGSNPNSKVSYINNDGLKKSVAAKKVLVTVSLGVLKANTIKFRPSLPKWKQEIINGMGFGILNKCTMYFSDIAWPKDELWFELLTPEEEDSGRWTTFFNPTSFKGTPSLIGWIGGQDAIDAEQQTDNQIVTDVMKNLRSMFPGIPDPEKVFISRWGQEENILGAYSYKQVGRDFHIDSARLQLPLLSRLYFAGEATSGGWAQTTTGAWESGEEAAASMRSSLLIGKIITATARMRNYFFLAAFGSVLLVAAIIV